MCDGHFRESVRSTPAPAYLMVALLAPRLVEFLDAYPELSLELLIRDPLANDVSTNIERPWPLAFQLKYSAGALARNKLMRRIMLYGRKVTPLPRDMLGAEGGAPPAAAFNAGLPCR